MKKILCVSIAINMLLAGYLLLKGGQLFGWDMFPDTGKENNRILDTEQITQASKSEDRITCDTVYVVAQYDLSTGREDICEEQLPASFIGMTRNQLLNWIDEHNLALSLEELEQGVLSVELVSFSEKEIKVRKKMESVPKIYPKSEEETPESVRTEKGYWSQPAAEATSQEPENVYGCILAQDGLLTVYDSQRRHVILYTDIALFDLSPELQQEILEGKNVRSEEELYYLLESYSS